MIQSKEDLRLYINKDVLHHGTGKPWLKDYILKNEWWYLYHYLYHMRHVEYYTNVNPKGITKRCAYKVLYFYHFLIYKRLSFLLHLFIYPNTCGPGLKICHFGDFTHIAKGCKVGANCEVLPGVVLGKKSGIDSLAIVGDNCFLGLGVKILGAVSIGNNVIVGANSVVTKDIPDNAVVGGVPAKIIRINE